MRHKGNPPTVADNRRCGEHRLHHRQSSGLSLAAASGLRNPRAPFDRSCWTICTALCARAGREQDELWRASIHQTTDDDAKEDDDSSGSDERETSVVDTRAIHGRRVLRPTCGCFASHTLSYRICSCTDSPLMSTPVTPTRAAQPSGAVAGQARLTMPPAHHLALPSTPGVTIPGQTATASPLPSPSHGANASSKSPQQSPASQMTAAAAAGAASTVAAAGGAAAPLSSSSGSKSSSKTPVRKVGKYVLGKTLGQGTFGKSVVAHALHCASCHCARHADASIVRRL